MKPQRIQLSRRKGWRMPPNTVKVDRSSTWGNPFVIGEYPPLPMAHRYGDEKIVDATHAVKMFRRALIESLKEDDRAVDHLLKLRGKNLACWCHLDQPCHADILLDLANREAA